MNNSTAHAARSMAVQVGGKDRDKQKASSLFSHMAVEIEDLRFAYEEGDYIFEAASLSVEQGDFLAIIGPNGGGKSTLLHLLLGLCRPQGGTVRIFGRNPASVRGHIGYVPQYSGLQPDFPASVLDVALMGGARPNLWGGSWRTDNAAKNLAMSYLDILGLADCAHFAIKTLSGGQRQRALVARALMGRPGTTRGVSATDTFQSGDPFLLLLDEPTASIDPQGKFCFYEFIGKLRGQVTVIVVSHDMFMNSPFFNHIVFVNRALTPLPDKTLKPEALTDLFGSHLHDCPLADLQHANGFLHSSGCTHPACNPKNAKP